MRSGTWQMPFNFPNMVNKAPMIGFPLPQKMINLENFPQNGYQNNITETRKYSLFARKDEISQDLQKIKSPTIQTKKKDNLNSKNNKSSKLNWKQKAKLKLNKIKNFKNKKKNIENQKSGEFSLAIQNEKIKTKNQELNYKIDKNKVLNRQLLESPKEPNLIIKERDHKNMNEPEERFELREVVRRLSGKFDNPEDHKSFQESSTLKKFDAKLIKKKLNIDPKMSLELDRSADQILNSLECEIETNLFNNSKRKKNMLTQSHETTLVRNFGESGLRKSFEKMKTYLTRVYSKESEKQKKLSNLDISVMETLRRSFDGNHLNLKQESRYKFAQVKAKPDEISAEIIKIDSNTNEDSNSFGLAQLMENYISTDEETRKNLENSIRNDKTSEKLYETPEIEITDLENDSEPKRKAQIQKQINNRYSAFKDSKNNFENLRYSEENLQDSFKQKIFTAFLDIQEGPKDHRILNLPSFLNEDSAALDFEKIGKNKKNLEETGKFKGSKSIVRKSDSTTDSVSDPHPQISSN